MRVTRRMPTWTVLALLVALVVMPAGCNIVGPLAYIVHGPARTPAAYELNDVPTVVFVDDRKNVIPQRSDAMRRLIAEKASVDLMEKGLLEMTIRPQDVIAVAKQNDRFQNVMSIGELGESVGAEQIIYVDMLRFADSPDGYTPQPSGVCAVKVIDVVNRVRLFPPPEATDGAHLVYAQTPPLSAELYKSHTSRIKVYELLATQVGDQVAKLFYSHETKELGGQLDPN